MSRNAMTLTLALLAFLGALPSQAGEALPPAAVPVGVTAPAPEKAGCAPSLDLLLQPKPSAPVRGEVCSAAIVESAAPSTLAPLALGGRTCRCSCGQPCKSDADCGPGGRCTAGITCC